MSHLISPPPPHPLLRMEPYKIFVVSSIILGTKFSHMYVTFDLIKLIFLLFMWVLVLSSNFAFVNVGYVNFKSNLSILTRFDETKCLSSHSFLKWVCLFTFFSLFEPFLLFIMLDKIKFCYPSIKILMDIKKRSYYTIHNIQIHNSYVSFFCIHVSIYPKFYPVVFPTDFVFAKRYFWKSWSPMH